MSHVAWSRHGSYKQVWQKQINFQVIFVLKTKWNA